MDKFIYEPHEWIDHIEDEDTGEVIQEGTPWCEKYMNHIEQGIYQLSVQCANCSGGSNNPGTNPDITLDDIRSLFTVIPNRVESPYLEPIQLRKDSFQYDPESGWYLSEYDLSSELTMDLNDPTVEKIWFDLSCPEDDPDIATDFACAYISFYKFNPETKVMTFKAFTPPEFDQTAFLDFNILYDIDATPEIPESDNPVMQVIALALNDARDSGKVTMEQIEELFKGHVPNKYVIDDFNVLITPEKWTKSYDVAMSKDCFDYLYPGDFTGWEVRTIDDPECSPEEVLAFMDMDVKVKIVGDGIRFRTYKKDEKEINSLPLNVHVRIDKIEGV